MAEIYDMVIRDAVHMENGAGAESSGEPAGAYRGSCAAAPGDMHNDLGKGGSVWP
jgi:hypothetical protein